MDIHQHARNVPIIPMAPLPDDVGMPTRLLLAKLVAVAPSGLKIRYGKIRRYTFATSAELMAKLAHVAQHSVPEGEWRGPIFRGEEGKGTALSLNLQGDAVVAFLLSRSLCAEFSTNYPAFSLGTATPKDRYYQPQIINGSDNKLACFCAFPPKESDGDVGVYADAFNIHLDVLDELRAHDGTMVKVRTPLVIDPEVRHPQGTTPPEIE